MTMIERRLRQMLLFQGLFYLATNLWALVAPQNFLSYSNPLGDVFEARSFAAISLVLAVYFLVGAWRKDLLRPAAFLGLGYAAAAVLVEIFYLPGLGLTILWFDLIIELIVAGIYVTLFFFRKEEEPEKKEDASNEQPAEQTPEKQENVPLAVAQPFVERPPQELLEDEDQ